MGEDLQTEELAELEVEANFATEGKGVIGKNFVLLEPQFALRWIREHRRLQTIEKDYLEACKFVDTEIVKTEGLGRAVEILRYERDKLWEQAHNA